MYSEQTVSIINGASLSGAIEVKDFLTGILTTPATLDATTVIGFTASSEQNGTFVVLKDQYNALVYITVTLDAAGNYEIPDAAMKCGWIKLFTCTTGGVAVAQTGAKSFKISLKG